MQSLSQNRTFHRFLLLGLIVAFMLIASWRFVPAYPPRSFASLDPFASDRSRANPSIDVQIQTLQDQLRSQPEDWQAYSQLGLAYLQRARETGDPVYYQKVEEALDQALAFNPADYASLSAKGALALARHDFVSALEWGEKARQINPSRTYAYGVIADAQLELGRYDEAIETLQAMVDLRPDMSSYSRISYVRELHGDIEGALELMQRAVESGVPGTENTAWVRTQLAALYFNTGDVERADLEYQRTLLEYPNYVYALAGLGRVRAAQGEMDEAIQFLERAVGIMPIPEFVIMLGDLYQTTGQQEAAEQQYKLVETIEKLYRANGVDMDMEIAFFHADHDQKLEETVALARKAYANRPGIHAADALAWVLYKTGNYGEAHKYSEEALQLGTRDPLKLFHAGMIALALGDKIRAREDLEQALAINPYFSILHAGEARQTLQALQP